MTMSMQQWEQIRATSLARAEAELRQRPITPSAEHGGWLVQSSKGDGETYIVRPKWAKSERRGDRRKSRGHYWWLLTCSCPAEGGGFVICWHKSAVYLYWQHCYAVKRMEGVGAWSITDGPLATEEPTAEVGSPTPEAAPAKGRPTRGTRPHGTASKGAKPRVGVARKKPPSSR